MNVFTPNPSTVCLPGLETRLSGTPKKGVNPADLARYLFFLAFTFFFVFSVVFSDSLRLPHKHRPARARPLRKRAFLFPFFPDLKTTSGASTSSWAPLWLLLGRGRVFLEILQEM